MSITCEILCADLLMLEQLELLNEALQAVVYVKL